ncbi:putative dehydrogenase [Acidipropionibacterium acidipropionici ATCC 4875]|uniref:Putative dehydrogenase n=1 Tax=Acidipropionibacterium acidipropionici (strain ATCC 4875 / DSM 20272 / JCM 6432 / NBRC 12425 / NCIMB 8070 / 4) TaxID=1171373 RepID=K7S895_ACIA4|nr:Gfo/Idh/MocA family oxidoreductase [Acidipropionibacterium acidipropionici]AFV90797.1 putative dehydrogenase [Acidipropionibacterium acidipropionici ATCC 4875]ALN15055.1 dehydrogenase [Acidipropionibacterium acidipropionici]APZ09196.1 dehydrogenase [Acidipropionibacterium acidipropionici]
MVNDDGRPVIGLVGAGGISRAHMPGLLGLAGEICDFSQDGAEELASEFSEGPVPVRIANSLGELLERCAIIDVVTPTPTHLDIVRAALEAGRDVICEKPMARTAAGSQALADLAADKGLHLYPAHVVRYFPEYQVLKDAVDAGRLGALAVLRFARSGAFPTTPWFADEQASGGIIMDQMIHDLDQARWIAGPISQVSAMRTRGQAAGSPVEAAHVILTHTNGVITQCSSVWGPPHLEFTTEYSAAGTGGTLAHSSRDERRYRSDLNGGDLNSADLANPRQADGFLPAVGPAEDPYTLELRDYVSAIQGGPQARVSATDGVEAVRIAEAALESTATGQPVELGGDAVGRPEAQQKGALR